MAKIKTSGMLYHHGLFSSSPHFFPPPNPSWLLLFYDFISKDSCIWALAIEFCKERASNDYPRRMEGARQEQNLCCFSPTYPLTMPVTLLPRRQPSLHLPTHTHTRMHTCTHTPVQNRFLSKGFLVCFTLLLSAPPLSFPTGFFSSSSIFLHSLFPPPFLFYVISFLFNFFNLFLHS